AGRGQGPGACRGPVRGCGVDRGPRLRLRTRPPMSTSSTVVVKVGSSSITDDAGLVRLEAIQKLCTEVAALRGAGHRVVIVTSGAIAAGLPPLGMGGEHRPRDAVTLQAVSAVGQSRL